MKQSLLISVFLLISAITTPAYAAEAPSALNAREFNKYWRIESEGPYKLSFKGDTAEINRTERALRYGEKKK